MFKSQFYMVYLILLIPEMVTEIWNTNWKPCIAYLVSSSNFDGDFLRMLYYWVIVWTTLLHSKESSHASNVTWILFILAEKSVVHDTGHIGGC